MLKIAPRSNPRGILNSIHKYFHIFHMADVLTCESNLHQCISDVSCQLFFFFLCMLWNIANDFCTVVTISDNTDNFGFCLRFADNIIFGALPHRGFFLLVCHNNYSFQVSVCNNGCTVLLFYFVKVFFTCDSTFLLVFQFCVLSYSSFLYDMSLTPLNPDMGFDLPKRFLICLTPASFANCALKAL